MAEEVRKKIEGPLAKVASETARRIVADCIEGKSPADASLKTESIMFIDFIGRKFPLPLHLCKK